MFFLKMFGNVRSRGKTVPLGRSFSRIFKKDTTKIARIFFTHACGTRREKYNLLCWYRTRQKKLFEPRTIDPLNACARTKLVQKGSIRSWADYTINLEVRARHFLQSESWPLACILKNDTQTKPQSVHQCCRSSLVKKTPCVLALRERLGCTSVIFPYVVILRVLNSLSLFP